MRRYINPNEAECVQLIRKKIEGIRDHAKIVFTLKIIGRRI